MKKLILILFVSMTVVSLASCDCKVDIEYITTEYSKESVDVFMSAFGSVQSEDFTSGYTFDAEHCYNVTPLQVKNETDLRIF